MCSGRSLSTGSSLLPWAVTASSFMVLASAAIVTGILSWFFHEYSVDGTHIIYQEVVVSTHNVPHVRLQGLGRRVLTCDTRP